MAVYHTSRIAGHAGWGAAIGGFTAATAPLSIPGYIYWKKHYNTTEENSNSN